MFERRLFYLQTRVDAAPRALPAGTGPQADPNGHRSRVFRLLGGHRRSGLAVGGAR